MTFKTTQLTALIFVFSILGIAFPSPVLSADKKKIEYEDKDLMFRVYRRSPQQIASFYEGRGFSQIAINEIKKYCSIAVIVKNKTNDVLWLDLDNWIFTSSGKTILRTKRQFWNALWLKIKLPLSHRATYGWTLMPEIRNLQKDEGVGGSIPLPMLTEPFTITANFPTGKNKEGKTKTVTLKNIQCKKDK